VDDDGGNGWYTSLELDANGRPHIGYNAWGPRELRYAYKDGSSWQVEVVDGEGSVGEYASLALDGDGRPHFSYYDYLNGDLKYARWRPFQIYLPAVEKQHAPF